MFAGRIYLLFKLLSINLWQGLCTLNTTNALNFIHYYYITNKNRIWVSLFRFHSVETMIPCTEMLVCVKNKINIRDFDPKYIVSFLRVFREMYFNIHKNVLCYRKHIWICLTDFTSKRRRLSNRPYDYFDICIPNSNRVRKRSPS